MNKKEEKKKTTRFSLRVLGRTVTTHGNGKARVWARDRDTCKGEGHTLNFRSLYANERVLQRAFRPVIRQSTFRRLGLTGGPKFIIRKFPRGPRAP